MTDATLTPDVFGPGEMGEAKAVIDNAPKPDQLSDMNLVAIAYHAARLADAANVAYWLQRSDASAFGMHVENCRESFAKLANLMGLTVVEE